MSPSWSTMCRFCQRQVSNFMQNFSFQVPSRQWESDLVLQGEISIVAWLFHTIPHMHWNGWKKFGYSLYESLMVHNMSFLPITNIKCHANLRFDHPLSIENMMLCCKYRYLLLMKCFIISLGCITIEEKASDSIYEPLMVHNVSFLSTTNLNLHTNI